MQNQNPHMFVGCLMVILYPATAIVASLAAYEAAGIYAALAVTGLFALFAIVRVASVSGE